VIPGQINWTETRAKLGRETLPSHSATMPEILRHALTEPRRPMALQSTDGRPGLWPAQVPFRAAPPEKTPQTAAARDGALAQDDQAHTEPPGEEAGETLVPRLGQERRELLMRILAGADVDQNDAGRRLGVTFSAQHQAAVLWSAPDSPLPAVDVVRFCLALARAVRAHPPLITLNRRGEVWMWTSWTFPLDHSAVTQGCSELTVPAGLRAAIGPIAPGMAGFRKSLLGAQAAQRTVRHTAGSWLCAYEDTPAVSALARDEEQARWFAEDVLGELARDEPWFATLRETLRLFLALGRSRQRVASALQITPTKVSYRVEEAVARLGRSIDALDVRVALEIAETMSWRFSPARFVFESSPGFQALPTT
jgi:DNA-binding PucR family transcriptional regulator